MSGGGTVRIAFLMLAMCGTLRAADTPTDDEKKTIAALVKLGGKATIDPTNLHPDARVTVTFTEITDATVAAIKKHTHVGSLTALDAKKCGEKSYTALKEVPHLRRLVLSSSVQTAKTVAILAEYGELRQLALPAGGLSDAELAAVKKLKHLEMLDVSDNAGITDKAMATVKELERLEILYFSNTAVSDRGLFELKGLDGLRTLYATNTKVTAEGAMKFADSMPNLRQVRR
ncbi:MAG TPA: hypothetical protein VMZ71_12825 [Gemmataceae bacterium]|nr:hypothetical protein [Gemmataceae bacterium]